MNKSVKSIEAMAEEIRRGDYTDFGKLLHLCAYIPKETLDEALKQGYEKEDIYQVLKKALYEFPITSMEFFLPKWVESLSGKHPLKMDIIEKIRNVMAKMDKMSDIMIQEVDMTSSYVKRCNCTDISMAEGKVSYTMDVDTKVIIQEYVDLAYAFFTKNEPKMINALLDQIAKNVRI